MKSKIVREAKWEVGEVGGVVEVGEAEGEGEGVKPMVKPTVNHRLSQALRWISARPKMEGLGAPKAPVAS